MICMYASNKKILASSFPVSVGFYIEVNLENTQFCNRPRHTWAQLHVCFQSKFVIIQKFWGSSVA